MASARAPSSGCKRCALRARRRPPAACLAGWCCSLGACIVTGQLSQERPDLTNEEVALLERKMGSDKKYTQKQMFREEIESPFRKTRLFLVPALAASAALGAFISGTRLIAASTGVTGYDVSETAQNLLINVASVVGLTLFYLNDKRARDMDLERIARAGKLSTLQIW